MFVWPYINDEIRKVLERKALLNVCLFTSIKERTTWYISTMRKQHLSTVTQTSCCSYMSYLHNLPSIIMNKEQVKKRNWVTAQHITASKTYSHAVSCHVYSVSTDFLYLTFVIYIPLFWAVIL